MLDVDLNRERISLGLKQTTEDPWRTLVKKYPVGAIVDLHQAKVNRIRRQSLLEAYVSMYVSFSGYRFIKEMADGLHATNEKVVASVPCYTLDCLPNAEAAYLCHNTVTQ